MSLKAQKNTKEIDDRYIETSLVLRLWRYLSRREESDDRFPPDNEKRMFPLDIVI